MRRSLLLVVLFVGACAKREESHDPTPTSAATAEQQTKSKGGSMPVYKAKVVTPMLPPRPPKSVAPDPLPAPAAAPSASTSASK
jgi:hypothetical protein